MKQYLKKATQHKNQTPQNMPIPGSKQKPNSAGGYTWEIDVWQRLQRFLILGSEGGSYYATEYHLTLENASAVKTCIETDGVRAVNEIVAVSDSGRAPKNDPAIFALAMAASLGDDDTRRAALNALPKVCRIGTHLFSFADTIKHMRGWGRGLRRAIGNWYTDKAGQRMAYQLVKYRQRNGWTHTDTLRLSHPKPSDETQQRLFRWVTHWDDALWAHEPSPPDDEALAFIWAFERAQEAKQLSTILNLIETYRLPREALPTEWLNHADVWAALLQDMPMTAMIRNLGVMSKVGLLKPMSDAAKLVNERLRDAERLRKARVHPIAVLAAQRVYAGGTALKGRAMRYSYYYQPIEKNKDWQPVPTVVDALDDAFYLAFDNVEPTNQRTMLALDVSGSMDGGMIAGVPGLTPREGSAAMAMVTARTEPNYMFTAFSSQMQPVNLSASMRLKDVVDTLSAIPMGGTDCALPMLHAEKHKIAIDTFIVYTDNQTWFGKIHPSQALQQYRQTMGIAAKLVVVGMVSNRFSIADPDDGGMLDVVGFDTAAPNLIADFARGNL